METKRYNVIRTPLGQARKRGRAEEPVLQRRTIQEIGEELGCADKVVVYNVLRYALVGAGAGTLEEMRRIEGARLEQAIQAIWPQVLRGNLDAVKTALQAHDLKVCLYGLDVPGDRAEPVEAGDTFMRLGAGDAGPSEDPTEEFPFQRLTTWEMAEKLGCADKVLVYDVVRYALVEDVKDTVEDMRRAEGATLEREIDAIWPQVLRGYLEAVKAYLQAVRSKVRLYGLSARGDQAESAEAGDTFIQVGAGAPKRFEHLTDEELLSYVASLEQTLHSDNASDSGSALGCRGSRGSSGRRRYAHS